MNLISNVFGAVSRTRNETEYIRNWISSFRRAQPVPGTGTRPRSSRRILERGSSDTPSRSASVSKRRNHEAFHNRLCQRAGSRHDSKSKNNHMVEGAENHLLLGEKERFHAEMRNRNNHAAGKKKRHVVLASTSKPTQHDKGSRIIPIKWKVRLDQEHPAHLNDRAAPTMNLSNASLTQLPTASINWHKMDIPNINGRHSSLTMDERTCTSTTIKVSAEFSRADLGKEGLCQR